MKSLSDIVEFDGFWRDGLRSGLGESSRGLTGCPRGQVRWAIVGAALLLGASWGLEREAVMAQPGFFVMQIPVPAPQARATATDNAVERFEAAGVTQQPAPAAVQAPLAVQAPVTVPFPVAGQNDVVLGEPLAIPEATVPVGRWTGRAGVKEVALAEMPWAGVGNFAIASTSPFQPAAQAFQPQYRVVVVTPSQGHVEALTQVMPGAVALPQGQLMQAGRFADWRQANALRRALDNYGFVVEVQSL